MNDETTLHSGYLAYVGYSEMGVAILKCNMPSYRISFSYITPEKEPSKCMNTVSIYYSQCSSFHSLFFKGVLNDYLTFRSTRCSSFN